MSQVNARSIGAVSANVVAAGKIASSSVVYVIKVKLGAQTWWVSRRYSEFYALLKAVEAATALRPCKECHQIETLRLDHNFPRKTFFNWSPRRTIDGRAKRLDWFLQSLLDATAGLSCRQILDSEVECDASALIKQFLLVYGKNVMPVCRLSAGQRLPYQTDEFDISVPIQSPPNSLGRLRLLTHGV